MESERYWQVWKKEIHGHTMLTIIKKIRADILESQNKSSDRYLALRTKFMGEILNQVQEKYENIPMSDLVIKTLDSIDNNLSTYHNATKYGNLNVVYQDRYNRLINNELWPALIKIR